MILLEYDNDFQNTKVVYYGEKINNKYAIDGGIDVAKMKYIKKDIIIF